mgnify:CR=1 FL=1
MTSFNSVIKFLYLPYPVPARVILGILLAIITPIVFIWTGILQTSCHPMLWWQEGTNPACWQISVEPESPVELQVGDSRSFTTETNNYITDNPSLKWQVEDNDIATFQGSESSQNIGVLTGKTAGETTISATFKSQIPEILLKQDTEIPKAVVPVKVRPQLKVEPQSLAIKVDDQITVKADFQKTPIEKIQQIFGRSKLEWSVENPEIATVNDNGRVTAKQVGETTIQVRFPNPDFPTEQEIPVKISQKPPQVTQVKLVPESTNLQIFPEETVQLDVDIVSDIETTAIPSPNGKQLTAQITGEGDFDPNIAWSSSNPQVATINPGMLKANQPGTVAVTAKSYQNPEQQDSQTIQINDPQKIFQITPNPLSVEPGIWQDLSVTLNEKPIKNDRVTWQSNQPNAIDVNNGRVCAYKSSSAAQITATLPENYSVSYPRLQNRISVQSKSIENKSSWLKRLGVDVGSCVVAGVGTTVLTANPFAGVAACVGAAAISETSIRVVDGGNRVAVDTCQPPEK